MRTRILITPIILLVVWTLSASFLACSKKRDMSSLGESSTESKSISPRAGIITGRELLANISEALNIDYLENSTNANDVLVDYGNFLSSLPKYGDHGNGFSSVMSRLMTNFVTRSCRIAVRKDFNNQSLSTRVVFRFINVREPLNSVINSKVERWRAFTKHLAYRMWAIDPPADELKIVDEFADYIRPLAIGTGDSGAQATQDAAMMICAFIGSSPRAFFKKD